MQKLHTTVDFFLRSLRVAHLGGLEDGEFILKPDIDKRRMEFYKTDDTLTTFIMEYGGVKMVKLNGNGNTDRVNFRVLNPHSIFKTFDGGVRRCSTHSSERYNRKLVLPLRYRDTNGTSN